VKTVVFVDIYGHGKRLIICQQSINESARLPNNGDCWLSPDDSMYKVERIVWSSDLSKVYIGVVGMFSKENIADLSLLDAAVIGEGE
jgi:hypothetical protein